MSEKQQPDDFEALEKAGYSDEALQDAHARLMHEKAGPGKGLSPLPIALILLFFALAFWGGAYIKHNSGGFDPLVYNEHEQPRKEGHAEEVQEVPLDVLGAKVYKKNCVACHQANGQGLPGAFPSLNGSRWVNGSEEMAINIILAGINGPIEVNGVKFNGSMPGLPQLKDRDLAAVLSYVRGNGEWGNTAGAITEEKVAEARAQYGSRSSAWTAAELLKTFPLE